MPRADGAYSRSEVVGVVSRVQRHGREVGASGAAATAIWVSLVRLGVISAMGSVLLGAASQARAASGRLGRSALLQKLVAALPGRITAGEASADDVLALRAIWPEAGADAQRGTLIVAKVGSRIAGYAPVPRLEASEQRPRLARIRLRYSQLPIVEALEGATNAVGGAGRDRAEIRHGGAMPFGQRTRGLSRG